MNKCPNCKAELLIDHSFCPKCAFDLRIKKKGNLSEDNKVAEEVPETSEVLELTPPPLPESKNKMNKYLKAVLVAITIMIFFSILKIVIVKNDLKKPNVEELKPWEKPELQFATDEELGLLPEAIQGKYKIIAYYETKVLKSANISEIIEATGSLSIHHGVVTLVFKGNSNTYQVDSYKTIGNEYVMSFSNTQAGKFQDNSQSGPKDSFSIISANKSMIVFYLEKM